MNVTKSEQKQIDRARVMGRGALMKTLAIIHRSGSKRTQNAIIAAITVSHWGKDQLMDDFKIVNGSLLHISEV